MGFKKKRRSVLVGLILFKIDEILYPSDDKIVEIDRKYLNEKFDEASRNKSFILP